MIISTLVSAAVLVAGIGGDGKFCQTVWNEQTQSREWVCFEASLPRDRTSPTFPDNSKQGDVA